MMRRVFLWISVAAIAAVVSACAQTGGNMTELQRAKAGDVDVVLLSPHDAIRHGQDSFVVEFRAADGALVDVGDVKATSTMPMPGQPMFGSLDVKKTSTPGRYAVEAKFDMAGTWRTTLEWKRDSRPQSATLASNIQ
jgi:hypothetical protein